jgi:hypothetical protein
MDIQMDFQTSVTYESFLPFTLMDPCCITWQEYSKIFSGRQYFHQGGIIFGYRGFQESLSRIGVNDI